jgi:hypothetical protein
MKKLLVAIAVLQAGLPLLAAVPVDYERQIKPILKARCYSCHGALKQESGLRLDTGILIRKGGENGAGLVALKPSDSQILERVAHQDDSLRMPPEGKPLSAEQIMLIRNWIVEGATSPANERPEEDPAAHWSFKTPVRHELPAVRDPAWSQNPIDAFVAARHEQLGLTPLPPAKKHILLRRVYLDLIGLPPSRDDLNTFLTDDSPDAYKHVVDKLLASRHYGERWGRHWMDIWRYSDWYGRRNVNDVRNSYPHIWRWRDWIIDSLNQDKGYDQMLREMIAADELHPGDETRTPALGFIVRNWFSLNYDTWKQDLVEHTGKAFLGLRLNCAHCHDHKYDPISQQEYFRFRAFFEPLELRHDRVPGGPRLKKYLKYTPSSGGSLKPIEAGLPLVYDLFVDGKTHMYRLGDTRDRMDRPPVEPGVPSILGGPPLEIQLVALPTEAWYPGIKPFVLDAELSDCRKKIEAAEKSLSNARSQLGPLAGQLAMAESALQALQQSQKDDSDSQARSTGSRDVQNTVGWWRFEGPADRNFLADSSGNDFTLHHITASDPPAQPFRLNFGKTRGFAVPQFELAARRKDASTAGTKKNSGTNQQAAEFQQAASFGFLGTRATSEFFSDTFSLECFVHFDVAKRNFNQTIAALDGSWTFLHRGLDDSSFELRLLLTDLTGHVHDLSTSKRAHPEGPPVPETRSQPMILKTGHDYFVSVVVGKQTVQIWSTDLTTAAPLRVFQLPRPQKDNQPVQLVKHSPEALFRIGNSDGTGCLDGLVDEVRLSRVALTDQQIAAAIGQPSDEASRQIAVTIATLNHKVKIAEMAIASAAATAAAGQAELKSVEARSRADQTRFSGTAEDTTISEVVGKAVRAEIDAKLATARSRLLLAEHGRLVEIGGTADAKKVKQFDSDISAALTALAAAKKQLDAPKADYAAFSPKYPLTSTGRRAALARWLTSSSNPLTARVAVNHVWGRHFGQPLVDNVVDFGRSGKRPSHPELLDWLATELMDSSMSDMPGQLESGVDAASHRLGAWRMKHLHRLIVTSQTYQLSSRPGVNHPNVGQDKDNTALWMFSRRRLEAETVRDLALAVSGQLDPAIGGPDLDPELEATSHRRSLYFSVYPEGGGMMPFMTLFDAPDPGDCYRRTSSIVPQQALGMSNSKLFLNLGRHLADKLSPQKSEIEVDVTKSDLSFVKAAFESVLSRPATADELNSCVEFLARQRGMFDKLGTASLLTDKADGPVAASTDPTQRARQGLIRVLLNHNDFVTLH